jgi:L-amino acid N-acyltransferase YncA
MSILIRPASAADLPPITAIYGQAVTDGTATFEIDPPSEAEMGERFRTGGFPYLVACAEDGRTVGYAYASLYRTRFAYRHTLEDSIYIDPAFHRRGVGRALLDRLVAESEARGFRQMVAVIGDSAQIPSIALHHAAGLSDGRHFRGGRLQVRPLARRGDDAARARRRRADDAVNRDRRVGKAKRADADPLPGERVGRGHGAKTRLCPPYK